MIHPSTPVIIRVLRWTLGILAAGGVFALAFADDAALAGPMTRIQRRATAEAEAAQNAVGEITYSVDEPGAATLRVGTSDAGTVVVSDPCAIHVAPRRRLDAGEYGITVTGPYSVNADGSINLASNVVSGVVTNIVTLRPVDPAVKIASVTWDLVSRGAGRDREAGEDMARLSVFVAQDEQPDPVGTLPGWAVLRGVEVWAWTTERRTVEIDTQTHPVPFRDRLGSTSLWDLRAWTTNRYDWRTAEHWAEFPAADTVRFAGHTVHYSAGGALRSSVDSGTWSYYASGVPVIRIVSGVSTNSAATDELRILAFNIEGTNALVDVSASLGVPVYIDSAGTLGDSFTRVSGQTSSYPSTVSVGGLPAYRVTVPLGASDTSCFYRAAATIDGGAENRALHLGGVSTDLYIAGARCAWTNIVVGGVTMRVLVSTE